MPMSDLDSLAAPTVEVRNEPWVEVTGSPRFPNWLAEHREQYQPVGAGA